MLPGSGPTPTHNTARSADGHANQHAGADGHQHRSSADTDQHPVPPTPTNTPVPPTPTPTPPPGGDVIYVSSSTDGTAGGVSFADEDILSYDTGRSWSMVFDGSDVGVTVDLNAFDAVQTATS